MSNQAQRFITDQVTGWVGTLMRDLDAQGTPVDIDDVIISLRNVIDQLVPTYSKEDFEGFLRELTDGRDD